uniref:Uncharacterized protein n=1 Tax=Glossina palpalis gambiensis TaxID=67801 RepID=A0A1B0B9V8_9MUSC
MKKHQKPSQMGSLKLMPNVAISRTITIITTTPANATTNTITSCTPILITTTATSRTTTLITTTTTATTSANCLTNTIPIPIITTITAATISPCYSAKPAKQGFLKNAYADITNTKDQ